jgi:LmbE family N-acetylglucosaminyl deacetylase
LEELRHACRVLDFDLIQAKQPDGLEQVNLRCQAEDVSLWQESVAAISAILRELRPDLIFLPHRTDANSTHIGTHYLVMDALAEVGTDLSCRVVETEFWAPNPTPNLMVESSTADLATLLRALVCHVGEVERNPYHLRLPAWMQDNVRRGGELVGAQGGAPPDFAFATLYRVRDWTGSEFREVRPEPRFLGSSDSVASVFP